MDINNKTLAVLLIAAIVVSLGGTMVVLNIGDGGLTGFATESEVEGTVHYNVSSNVVLSFTDDTLEFGTGYVNTTGGATNCSLTTEASGNSADCVDFTPQADQPLTLENIGNKDVYLNLTFIENIVTGGFIAETPSSLYVKLTDTTGESGSCTTNGLSSYTDAETFDANAEIAACALFESEPATNSVDIDVNLTIHMDESGSETITLKAIGTEI